MLHRWYYCENMYTPEQCKIIVDYATNSLATGQVDRFSGEKKVDTRIVDTERVSGVLKSFYDFNDSVNKEIFGFDLYPTLPPTSNLNFYYEGYEYPYHIDDKALGMMSNLKMTAVINLSSEPYTGGEFYIFHAGEKRIEAVDKPGSVLIFPSFMNHRVAPVTSGTRVTLSVWYSGPNWK